MYNWWENTSHNSPWHPPANPFGPPASPPPNPFGNSVPVHGGFVTGDQISRNVVAGQQWANDNRAQVVSTAHALLQCDRQYRAATAACNDAVRRSALVGGVAAGVGAGASGAGDVTKAAKAGVFAGAIEGWWSSPDCRNKGANDALCRDKARHRPEFVYFPGKSKW